MNGIPGLSPHLQSLVDESREIHSRVAALVKAVTNQGSLGTWEQPPTSVAHLEPCNQQLFQSLPFRYTINNCRVQEPNTVSEPWAKQWMFKCSHSSFEALDLPCLHSYQHPSFAGLKDSLNQYISKSTATYPNQLCVIYATALAKATQSTPQVSTRNFAVWHEATSDEALSSNESSQHPNSHRNDSTSSQSQTSNFQVLSLSTSAQSAHYNVQSKQIASTTSNTTTIDNKTNTFSESSTSTLHAAENFHLRDEGGINSSADWSSPHFSKDILKQLRAAWLKKIAEWGLNPKLRTLTASDSSDKLFSAEQSTSLREDLKSWLSTQNLNASTEVPEGQPFTLHLWDKLAQAINDEDPQLPSLLLKGVSTGIDSELSPSGIWRSKPDSVNEDIDHELTIHEHGWPSATNNPEVLAELIQDHVKNGWLQKWDGALTEAKEKFGNRIAVGKFGIAFSESRPPRLVGDAAVSGANIRSCIPESIELPGLYDVQEFISRNNHSDWSAFTFDFKSAHMRIRIQDKHLGYGMFTGPDDSIYYYKTCFFGATWSSWWWSRVAAFIIRSSHKLLWVAHFLAVYVDDGLLLGHRNVIPMLACLLLCFLEALGVSLSWKKLELSPSPTWIGWTFVFAEDRHAVLPENKIIKLRALLLPLVSGTKRIPRTQLQSLVGLLVWFTEGAYWLRPWLQHFFKMLFAPRQFWHSANVDQLAEITNCLSQDLVIIRRPVSIDANIGWKLASVNKKPVTNLLDMSTPSIRKERVTLLFLDSLSETTRLTSQAQQTATLFWNTVSCSKPISSQKVRLNSYISAADAFAEGTMAGIGGWASLSSEALAPNSIHWFAIQVNSSDLPNWMTSENELSLQRVISSLEALAQLCLLALYHDVWHHGSHMEFSIPQQCDNQGVVFSSSRHLSMKSPLAEVLQCAGYWSSKWGCSMSVSHVAGSRNDWADVLSRGPSMNPELWKKLNPNLRFQPNIHSLVLEPFKKHSIRDAPSKHHRKRRKATSS
jgi:hypothetical protein